MTTANPRLAESGLHTAADSSPFTVHLSSHWHRGGAHNKSTDSHPPGNTTTDDSPPRSRPDLSTRLGI